MALKKNSSLRVWYRDLSMRLEGPSKANGCHSLWKLGGYKREKLRKKNHKFSWLSEYGVEERVRSNVGLECFIPGIQKYLVTPIHLHMHTHLLRVCYLPDAGLRC